MKRLVFAFSSVFFVLFPLYLLAQEKEVTLEPVVALRFVAGDQL